MPSVNRPNSQFFAESVDQVRRQWGSAVEEGAKESASIKSSAFHRGGAEDAAQAFPQAPDAAAPPPRRNVATGEPGEGAGDFVLGGLLGKGGMGLVFRAEQAGLDRGVALKTIIPDRAKDAETRGKFYAEARVTGQLDHPNIVPIYELASAPDGSLFYTMKEVRGRPWSKALPTLSEAENIDILLKVADAAAFAHDRGVIHRDLKPENVMLGDYGEVLLMDWGLAVGVKKGAKAERLSQANARGGTPAYMAPEMAKADPEKIGPASDIYLLGAILYEILTGLRPHTGPNVFACIAHALLNAIQAPEGEARNDEWMGVARKALATNPAGRHKDVKEFQRALRDCKDHAASLALSREAKETLSRARKAGDYTEYARSVFGFGEAIRLWPGNGAADMGLTMARKAYAEAALARGDFDLALSQTGPMTADEAGDLPQRAEAGKTERERRRLRVRKLTQLSAGLAGLLVLVGLVAYGLQARAYARASRAEQETRRALAASDASERRTAAALERIQSMEAEREGLSLRMAALVERMELGEKAEQFIGGTGEMATGLPAAAGEMLPWVEDLERKSRILAALAISAWRSAEREALAEAFTALAEQARERGRRESSVEGLDTGARLAKRLGAEKLAGQAEMMASALRGEEATQPPEVNVGAAVRFLHEALREANPAYDGGGRFRMIQGRITQADLSEAFPRPQFTRRGRGHPQPDHAAGAVDLEPLRGLPLEVLDITGLPVASLAPLQGMPLRELRANIYDRYWWLELPDKPLDLAPLAGMPLEYLELTCRPVVDLAPLAGTPLKVLYIDNAPVRSLAPLRGMSLEELHCGLLPTPRRAGRDGNYHSGYPDNPNEYRLVGPIDLSPLRGMGIKKLVANFNLFTSLDGLEGMPIEHLDVNHGRIQSLEPLAGAPLMHLSASSNRIDSLAPLRGMPLTTMDVEGNNIRDLEPLRDMALRGLDVRFNPVESFAPLRGMATLESLSVRWPDNAPCEELRGLPLTSLTVSNDDFMLEHVEGAKLRSLEFNSAKVRSLAPLRDMTTLTALDIGDSPIDDLTPIKGLSLISFGISRHNPLLYNADKMRIPREMKSIYEFTVADRKGVNRHSYRVERFWEKYDGEAAQTGQWKF